MTSRQLRKRKDAPVLHVPQIMDDIFVCWLVQGVTFWWPASVLEVLEFDDVHNSTYGRGRLLYKKHRSYDPEEAEVAFCYKKQRGHYLTQQYEGSRLEMSWSTSIPQPLRQKSPDSSNNSTTANGQCSTDLQPRFDAETGRKRKSARGATSPVLGTAPVEQTTGSSSAPAGMAISADEHKESSFVEKSARAFLDNVLEGSKQYLSFMDCSRFHEQLSVLVMHELRIDLVSELHRNFRTTPSQLHQGPSELHQKCLRTSVSCSLHTFSCIAKSIKCSNQSDSVQFFPTYERTQKPSVATDRFTVYFDGIKSLSKTMGFNDNRDFDTLYWREKSHDDVLYTRVIGSLSTSATSTKKAPDDKKSGELTGSSRETNSSNHDASKFKQKMKNNDEEDLIFVGLSMNASVSSSCSDGDSCDVETIELSTAHNTQDKTMRAKGESNVGISQSDCCNSLVLKRSRALWDDESNMYLTHWEGQSNNITVNAPPDEHFSRRDKKLDSVFALRWEAKPLPRTSAWTVDALRTDNHTLGRLEVIIPWVLVTGQQCLELGDILSKQSFKIRP